MHTARFVDPSGSIRTGPWRDGTVSFGGRSWKADEVDILAPCQPTKIVCVGLNYRDHAAERDKPLPDRPHLFLKPPNTVAGHEDAIVLPEGKQRVDHEAELGVVIARQCRNVAASEAMEVVAGYTCINDVSNRDDQDIEQNWVRGKAFDGACPMGPVVATPDELAPDARIQARLDGEIVQDSSIEQLIFPVPELIEEITRYLTLEPGDVITTGTPSGVGPLSPGQTIEIEIEGIGTLRNHVVGA